MCVAVSVSREECRIEPRGSPVRRHDNQSHPVLVENLAAGLTWDFDVAMISARVRDAGLPAAGDHGVLAGVAGAVLLVQDHAAPSALGRPP